MPARVPRPRPPPAVAASGSGRLPWRPPSAGRTIRTMYAYRAAAYNTYGVPCEARRSPPPYQRDPPPFVHLCESTTRKVQVFLSIPMIVIVSVDKNTSRTTHASCRRRLAYESWMLLEEVQPQIEPTADTHRHQQMRPCMRHMTRRQPQLRHWKLQASFSTKHRLFLRVFCDAYGLTSCAASSSSELYISLVLGCWSRGSLPPPALD